MSSDRVERKSIRLGYQTIRPGAQRSEAWKKRQALRAYADRKGFRMGQLFVHDESGGRMGTLGSLIRAAKDPQVVAVAVISATDLALSPRIQDVIRYRLENRAGVQVLVVEP